MKLLELFAGTCSVSNVFKAYGHETYTVDWDKQHDVDWHVDINEVTAQDIIERFGHPDVIWASPDCTTYSLAAISHHRQKNPVTGNLDPITDYAKFCDKVNAHVLDLIRELDPTFFFIENPRGGLCNMDFMQGIPKHLVTYCQYGDTRMKPTHIFTDHPNPRFKHCKNGDKCHVPAPRGSQTGTQGMKSKVDKARIPDGLCKYIVEICEDYIKTCSACGNGMTNGYCIEDGQEYYCSDECLHEYYSAEEYDKLCQQDAAYWTDWSE